MPDTTDNNRKPPYLRICRVPSGWVEMCNMQFLPGYCILRADPQTESINTLEPSLQARFLADMALVGDALIEVTGAYRINYAILGNSDPVLHAHIVPRFWDEPEGLRKELPWISYDPYSRPMDIERDRELIEKIASAIQKRLAGSA
jgi:diadenosine tetraphosphate (Ap4A) HIT family hydrolase